MVLSVHYRSLSEFSETTAELAIKALARIYSSLSLAESLLKEAGEEAAHPEFEQKLKATWEKIEATLNDDFGTPEAFALIFDLVRDFNQQFRRGMKLNPKMRAAVRLYFEFIRRFGSYFSLFQAEPSQFLITLDDRLLEKKNLQRAEVERLVQARQKVREAKDFQKADELRAALTAMGIQVADTPQGSFWEVQK
jgi:cysteinyl-tRNA synthetase